MKHHLKRVNASKSWKLLKKTNKFIRRPRSGGHAFSLGVGIGTLFTEIAPLAQTSKEMRRILHTQEVLVNGKRVIRLDTLVGFMDIITIPKQSFSKRVTLDEKGFLHLEEVTGKDAVQRLLKLTGKTLRKDAFQLNCLDGTNLRIEKNQYGIGDTIVFDMNKKSIVDAYPLVKGATIILHAGKKRGTRAKVVSFDGDTLVLEQDGQTFETKKRNAFVIKKP